MKKWHFVGLAFAALSLASCGLGDQLDPIEGAWELDKGTHHGDPILVVATHPITLTFEKDRFGGVAACNSYGGAYTFAGSQILLTEFAVTEMACHPQRVMESEATYLQALLDVEGAMVEDGQLILSGNFTRMVFGKLSAVPTVDLQGTVWVLDGLVEGDTVSSPSGDPATLELFSDGSLIGSTGCRTLTGRYVVFGAQVRLTDFAAHGECPRDTQFQDNLVVTVLGGGFQVLIDDDTLTLNITGDEGLIYKAES